MVAITEAGEPLVSIVLYRGKKSLGRFIGNWMWTCEGSETLKTG